MYIASVLNLLSWPLLILVSYLLIRWAVKVYEKKHTAVGNE